MQTGCFTAKRSWFEFTPLFNWVGLYDGPSGGRSRLTEFPDGHPNGVDNRVYASDCAGLDDQTASAQT